MSFVMPGMFATEGLGPEVALIDGDPPDWEHVQLFVPGTGPGNADGIADTIAFVISRPEGFAVNEIVARPTGQLIS